MIGPLCFVLMPFGKKLGSFGVLIDFDAVYNEIIAPAILDAGLEPLRADEEKGGGIIHKPMFERLVLCEYAVADLTTANANVFYELGVRHATRPWSTVLIYAEGSGRLPFDIAQLRALPYKISASGVPEVVDEIKSILTRRLTEARDAATDSPVYQLLDKFPDIDHTKTDVFRDRVRYSNKIKNDLCSARKQNVTSIREIETKLGPIGDVEAGVVIDLLLSYRAVNAWEDMVELTKNMSAVLAETVMVQEQLGFALNRLGRRDEAEIVLNSVISKHGPSSETYGILGRVYKDRWEEAAKTGNTICAKGFLKKAIDRYLKGFEADWRDAYPGINAITLMEISDPPDPRRETLITVVNYAVEQKFAKSKPDYWDFATVLELSVLSKNELKAKDAIANASASIREKWEPETTARNLAMIREAREKRGEVLYWANEMEEYLKSLAK